MEVSKDFGPLQQHANRSNHCSTSLQFILNKFKVIKSFIDIGCGLGEQVRIAKELGLIAYGIDGDPSLKIYDDEIFIQHDFTTEPFLSGDYIYDLGWTVEFVEHVEEKYIDNYMPQLSYCNRVLMTYAPPGQNGRHHVNCQPQSYWINIFDNWGFELDIETSYEVRMASINKWIRNKALFFTNRRLKALCE